MTLQAPMIKLPPPVLEIHDLDIEIKAGSSFVKAVDGIDLTLKAGQTLALVGESGAGKSLTALAIMRLLTPGMRSSTTRCALAGKDLSKLSAEEMRRVRGREIAMIFQDPLTALNPVHTIGRQIIEAVRLSSDLSRTEARARALELLDMVRMPAAASRMNEYPHRLSGGMRQRVVIAMALAGQPKVVLADEPTTALDVTVAAQILLLLKELQQQLGLSMLLITHDLHAVRAAASEVAVMYSGRIVEYGDVETTFAAPRHPYTAGLLAARAHGGFQTQGHRLKEIAGTVPAPDRRPPGCAFQPRCFKSGELCTRELPLLTAGTVGNQLAACHYPMEFVG